MSKSDERLPMIALDVGTGRIGVAILRDAILFINHLDIISRDGSEFEKVSSIVKDENVKTIVIGLPKTLKAEIGPQAEKVLQFVDELRLHLISPPPVEIVLWDERFTSVIAHRIFRAIGLTSKKERKIKDSLEAELILESYINYLRRELRKKEQQENQIQQESRKKQEHQVRKKPQR
ncbi:MAG: Holliday junction resolvase RuvX [Caldiserica bacterium]|nr:Holliday junction resolvase RuvX [Caldisericota bacterium]